MNKATALILYSLISCGLIALCFLASFSLLWQIIFISCIIITLVGLFLGKLKYPKIYKAFVAILILEVFIILVYLILEYSGLLQHFTSIEAARNWFKSFGAWAWAIFFLIQVAQVIILPIPAQITTIAGVLIFGGWLAFLISALAVIIGSFVAFAIGRSLGVKVAYKISSKETVDKYRTLLTKKGVLLLPIMFIFPLFPDDLLCFIAGTTEMTWLYFIVVTLLTRTFGIGCICLFGSGDIIPFSGWGIPVWIILIILLIVVAFFLLKYQNKITDWIIKVFGKNRKKQTSETEVAFDKDTKSQTEHSADYVIFAEKQDDKVDFSSNKTDDKSQNTVDDKSKIDTEKIDSKTDK